MRLALYLGLLAAVGLATTAGFLAGRGAALGEFDAAIESFSAQETLGHALEAEARRGRGVPREAVASAYLDPERALAEMDTYAWAVPTVPTPFVGYAPQPGTHGTARINAQQLRHPVDLAVPKPPDTLRILLTGGSTALSSGAPFDDRTIAGYLEALLAADRPEHVEVATAACQGWSTTHERIWTTHRLIDLEPDLVVSLSGLNDVHWAAVGADVRFFRAYDDQLQWSLVARLYQRLGRELRDPVPPRAAPIGAGVLARRLRANVEQTRAALADREIPFVFALQPNLAVSAKAASPRERQLLERDAGGPRSNRVLRRGYQAIRKVLTESPGLDAVDLSGVFDATGRDEEIFLDRYHFGDRGNRAIARAIADEIGPRLADRR